jgi:hypothetical protein
MYREEGSDRPFFAALLPSFVMRGVLATWDGNKKVNGQNEATFSFYTDEHREFA